MGAARWQRPLSKDGQRGLGAVQSVRLTAGAHVVFFIIPKLSKPAQI
jgi:hypothetical protein